jgi:hypothetical protein
MDYVRTFRAMRTILLVFAFVALMGYPWSVLLPVFAAQVLQGGPHTLGRLSSASGIGALASALSLAVRKSVAGRMLQVSIALLEEDSFFSASRTAYGCHSFSWSSSASP